MADLIPPMLIQLQADVSQLKAGLAQAESALKGVDDSVKTASAGMTSFVSKMKQVGATMGVAFAGQQVVQFGKDVIMAASNMNESLAKMQVVFGENASAVEKWADTSSTAMGMSKQSAVEAAGTYGNLFQAFGLGQQPAQEMSTILVQLASDLASFNNTSIDDAILALRSGLSGETEPLKKFGVALSEARLKEQAMSMGLIKSTKEALTPAAKAQASYALIMKDTILAQGDFARTGDGTANTMRTLQANMENAKAALGAGLLPAFNALLAVLKPIIASMASFGKFLAANKEAVTVFIGVLAAGTAAWGLYTLAINASTIATKAWTLVTKANPIGLIITAVALLSAGMVMLWNKSETARKIMIEIGKAGVMAISFIIKMVGELVTGMMKLVTGPMRLLLKGLSLLGVKEAGTALKEINNIIDTTGKFFDDAAKKVEGLTAKLDALGKAKPVVEKATTQAKTNADTVVSNAKSGLSDEEKKKIDKEKKRLEAEKKKLDGYKKDVADIYKDINEVIADAQDAAKEVLETRNEQMFNAHKNYDERVADLKDRANETRANAQARYDEISADALKDRGQKEKEILKDFADQKLKIESDYASKTAEISENYSSKVFELMREAEENKTKLIEDAATKRESITQQSMDRLRSAFASKTGFNIGEAFSGGAQSVDKILQNLQKKIKDAKTLQANAAALAGMGYSQTFIEQVVSQGPEAGNKIAEALKKGTPESTREMQKLFGEIGDISENGLNGLAKVMNEGGNLATQELRKAYLQVSIDLAKDLQLINKNLALKLQEAQNQYMMAMAIAAEERRRRLEENQRQMEEALAAQKAKFDERMADALKELEKARLEAQKDLDKGLVEAQKTLTEALEEAQKGYEKSIDRINDATEKKLNALKSKLLQIASLIQSISGMGAGGSVVSGAPTVKPIIPSAAPAAVATDASSNITNNVTVIATTDASPQGIADSVVSAVRYGMVVAIQ
jgi:hypothetical protein